MSGRMFHQRELRHELLAPRFAGGFERRIVP
jgi:hypothetical protein